VSTNNLNFIFWGTPDVAKETLDILKENGLRPSLIITSPDARQGRKMILTPPPVKIWAEENKISCLQPKTKAELLDIFISDESAIARGVEKKIPEVELSVVVAYGKIIPEKILNVPKFGSINIHYSLLPKYRGASPVESAILHGDTITGVTIQKMTYKMDAGDIIAQKEINILSDETTPELRKRLIKLGGELLIKTLNNPSLPQQARDTSPDIGGGWVGVPQKESLASVCKKIKKEDGLLNLSDLVVKPPSELYNKFRAYAHWPRTFFFKNGKRIIITKAHLENNPLDPARGKKFVIDKIIPEGGKETSWKN
jgi:methionyl-tRNA formyltransferase